MKLMVKIILVICVAAVFAGCSNSPSSPALEQNIKAVQQVKDDHLKLEERVKMLENQVKALNEELYRNSKRTEALEEVYDYVAKDNEMPGTGEEPPDSALD